MSSFNSTADLLLDHLSTMADGKTQICMVDEFARAALDVICKVSNTDTTETAEKFDFSSKEISFICSPRLPAGFPTGERGSDYKQRSREE